jgi:hypothetical protein
MLWEGEEAMRGRRTLLDSFWLQLALQTAGLLSVSGSVEAHEMAPILPFESPGADGKTVLDVAAYDSAFLYSPQVLESEAFLYTGSGSAPTVEDDVLWTMAERTFDQPALLTSADRDLLGGLDFLDHTDGADAWLFTN